MKNLYWILFFIALAIFVGLGWFVVPVGEASEMYKRSKHSEIYNNRAGNLMCWDVEQYTEENVAEIIIGHIEHGGRTKNNPIYDEARKTLIEVHGEVGDRRVLPNGWATTRRSYKNKSQHICDNGTKSFVDGVGCLACEADKQEAQNGSNL